MIRRKTKTARVCTSDLGAARVAVLEAIGMTERARLALTGSGCMGSTDPVAKALEEALIQLAGASEMIAERAPAETREAA